MKKIISILISTIMLMSTVIVNAEESGNYSPCLSYNTGLYNTKQESFALNSDQTLIMVDGDMKGFTGIIKNGTTFVPVRAISELFDKQVLWYPETRQIRIDETILLQVGGNLAKNGDEDVILSYPPFIYNDTTFVPIRFIAESFDKEVGFVPKEKWGFDNSLVWIEEKNSMDNGGLTITEITDNLQNFIYNNYDSLVGYNGYSLFNLRKVENIEYVGQLGRYAVFNSDVPIMVDAVKGDYYIFEGYDNYKELYILNIEESDYDNKNSTEKFTQNLDNNMGSVDGLEYFDNSEEIPSIKKVDYIYSDDDGNLKFTATATQWGTEYDDTTLIVNDASGREVLKTTDLILTGRFDVVFEDMNFDGYVDIVTYNGGTMNALNIIFLWNEEKGVFEKAEYDGFSNLSFYEVEDGYIKNFIRGGSPDESYTEKLVWKGNKLTKESEE